MSNLIFCHLLTGSLLIVSFLGICVKLVHTVMIYFLKYLVKYFNLGLYLHNSSPGTYSKATYETPEIKVDLHAFIIIIIIIIIKISLFFELLFLFQRDFTLFFLVIPIYITFQIFFRLY